MTLTSTRKKILVVDDESLIRWSLGITLQGEDFDVHLAESAEAAISMTESVEFDLVITDYRLEHSDGLAFAEQVKAHSPNTKIFLITAYGNAELRSRARALGVEAFIDKPFDMSQVTSEVRKHLQPAH